MSWANNMLEASFEGIPFECLSTDDSRTYTQATFQSPYSNDAQIDFMGADPEEMTIHAMINGDDYEDQLEALKAALDQGKGLLVHPVYGEKQVSVVNRQIHHDDELVDGCMITMQFKLVEDNSVAPLFADVPATIPDDLAASVLVFPTARLQQAMDQSTAGVGSFSLSQLSSMINSGLTAVRQEIGVVTTDIDNFLSPPDWITSILADATSLADGISSGRGAIAAWRSMLSALSNIGNIFDTAAGGSDAMPEPLQQVSRSLVVSSTIGAAQALLMGEIDNPTFTPPELSQIRADVRSTIQIAIDAERAAATQVTLSNPIGSAIPLQTSLQIASLKSAAATIQTQVQALIERRPPFVTKQVPILTCSRWLAFKLYGDHTRARELVRLNPQVASPVLLAGQEVFAYAS